MQSAANLKEFFQSDQIGGLFFPVRRQGGQNDRLDSAMFSQQWFFRSVKPAGVWFDLKLVGGFFEKLANELPFVHAAEMEKALFNGNFEIVANHFLPILLYGVLVTVVAVFCFLSQMKKQ